MKILILISAITIVNCRPQSGHTHGNSPVQIEKVEVHEIDSENLRSLSPSNFDSDELKRIKDTEEILQKIIEVNKRHGLTPKGLKTDKDYIRVPILQRSGTAKQANFQFSNNPFTNPILDYLLQENNRNHYGVPSNDINKQVTAFSVMNTNPKIEPEDNVPGQYIKRKVTHHQTLIMPVLTNPNNPNFVGYPNQPQQYPGEMPQFPNGPALLPPPLPPQQQQQPPNQEENSTGNSSHTETLKKKLENQTVENIKNIIHRQVPPPQFIYNPYYYPQNQIYPYFQAPIAPNYYGKIDETQPYSKANPNSYRINGPNAKIPNEILQQQYPRPGKQWEWPLAQYFPIVIKDPLQQILTAFTTMVEYGPPQSATAAAATGPQCATKDSEKNGKTLINDTDTQEVAIDPVKNLSEHAPTLKVLRNSKSLPLDLNNQDYSHTSKSLNMDIEDLEMSDDKNNPMRLTFSFKGTPDVERALKDFNKQDGIRLNTKVLSPLPTESARKKDQSSDSEVEKGLFKPKDKIKDGANDSGGIVKLTNKDNTGSGVFIHKLKVRKGGVAIAGPGGIATAGSGGTAIVGPNGYAYTQPDSVAIAGSGTKVVAVEPGVNLSEVIASVKKNGTGISPRLGKIVAVGPVIYYNKG